MLLLLAEVALAILPLGPRAAAAAAPFSFGLFVFGALFHFFSELCLASFSFERHRNEQSAAIFPAILAACMALGVLVPALAPLANLALIVAYAHLADFAHYFAVRHGSAAARLATVAVAVAGGAGLLHAQFALRLSGGIASHVARLVGRA